MQQTTDETGIAFRDIVSEAAAAITARPARSILTAIGTVLGVGTLVVIVGLTATAAGQVSARFDAQTATLVTVTDSRETRAQPAPYPFDAGAIGRAERLNGVQAVGVAYSVPTDDTIGSPNPGVAAEQHLPIFALSPGAWRVVGPRVSAGRTFDEFSAHLRVAVLGSGAAARLGITGKGAPTAIDIGGRPFLVAGVIDDVDRRPDLLLAVIIPAGTAADIWGEPTPKEEAELLIATQPGAAQQVAREARIAVSINAPRDIQVQEPPDPRQLRESISSDLSGLLLVLAAICLLVGCVGIANTTLVAIMERSPEFGLRRALGARGRDIAVQVLAESAGLGLLGGFLGAGLGVMLGIAIALARNWSPIVEPWCLLWAPALGLVSGVLAGMYPARRATRIEPTEALRGQ